MFVNLNRFAAASFLMIFSGLLVMTPGGIYCRNSTPGGSTSQHPGPKWGSGTKYIHNYSRKDNKNHSRNWSIVQDNRGIIYVGNNGGLMEFDGRSWRDISVPNTSVRSLAVADNGTIFVGGINEIGFLTPGSNGSLKYRSLIRQVEKKYRNFAYVWGTLSTGEGICFRTSKYLFLWDFTQVKVWKAKSFFHACFLCKGKLYIQEKGIGLLVKKENSLDLVPGGEEFADDDKNLYMLVPYDSKRLLYGTRRNGIFIYNGKTSIPFPTGIQDYLKEKELFHGIRLSCGDFALATRRGGLVVIDSHGALKGMFNKSSGLQDNSVKYVCEDSQGNLWLALGQGITKIEYSSPISIYDESRSNLPGKVLCVGKHGPHNDLYAGTTTGLYLFAPTSPSSGSNGRFRPVPGISSCSFLLSTGDALLAATNEGVFSVEHNNRYFTTRLVVKDPSFILERSTAAPNRIWVGTNRGLVSLYLANRKDQLTVEHQFKNINREIRTIVENKKGDLWLGMRVKNVLKISFSTAGTIKDAVMTGYNSSHGLPPEEIQLFFAAGHVIFATGKGIFRFDEEKKVFLPDHTLGDVFAGGEYGREVLRIAQDKHKNIWFHSRARNIQAVRQPDQTFFINTKPFLRIPGTQVNFIYPDNGDNTVWFAGVDGLIRFDTAVKKNCDLDFPTLIRQVWVSGVPVFNGAPQTGEEYPVISCKDRNLRFQFAAPFYEGETETRYRYFLEGSDDDWSGWTKETRKDYTNLDAGVHTFRVQAKNVYGNPGREARFRFKVLPPWYKIWWAYLLYAAAAFLAVFLVVKWRSRILVLEKEKLEHIIHQRTGEIENKNRQLLEQSRKLKEMDAVKSRFFANISHEFRTPLTLIIGPLEQMIASRHGDAIEKKKELTLMLRNAQRLLSLINQLLELSKLDSGKMKLQAGKTDIISFIKGIIASFQLLAHHNELNLVFHTEQKNKNAGEEEELRLYIDYPKMEDVVCNLLINAVKFTPPGGEITVTVRENPMEDTNFPAGFVEVSVCDTGPGVPEEQLGHIFDRFYQADSTYEHHQKGSGIGLALVKELVELHHGTIEAGNSESGGSEFILRLPMGSAHLVPGDMIHRPSSQTKTHTPNSRGISAEIQEPGIEVEKEENKNEYGLETVHHLESEAETNKKNIILVVEDSAEVRDYVKGALESTYTVAVAKDGREGIEKAQEIIPDLVVSDIMMPGVDGCELCRVLKKDIKTSHIPIILLTVKASVESVVTGLENGADDYITKPFSTIILKARIKNLIDLRRHMQQIFNREMTRQPGEISVSSIEKEFVKDLKAVIEQNLSDPDFNVEEMCRRLYMSRPTLYRKLQALSGESPTDFIRSYRLKRAAQLLEQNFGSVTEVAFEVGFSSRSYFTKCFKEKFHQLPSDYQTLKTGAS